MSQQELTKANSSGNAFLRRDLYYFGVSSGGRGPKLVYRTSTDVFQGPTGPHNRTRTTQLLPVSGHSKLSNSDLWNTILKETVKILDKHEIKFTSIDPVRFAWDDYNEDGSETRVTSRFTIWIGVLPESTTTEAAFHASQGILELLKQHEIDDLDVAFRESVVRQL
ncbi:hypothetical protein DFP72DRAFT_1074348 [Ephemerocybe angulata]|uniref:Uncharacterized protein n=1 Tax=Ephemerocybe angulata TaxID=980116 RepID=A0A8H6HMK1_9AGAR|nr:hypothetical protein DFP72DRAFT_1074348 [Tulosesus angulatus]